MNKKLEAQKAQREADKRAAQLGKIKIPAPKTPQQPGWKLVQD